MIEATKLVKSAPAFDEKTFTTFLYAEAAIAGGYHATASGWFDKIGVFAGQSAAEVCKKADLSVDTIPAVDLYIVTTEKAKKLLAANERVFSVSDTWVWGITSVGITLEEAQAL